jgi:(p)ppGpp synthase/HD superfamily hydrolase
MTINVRDLIQDLPLKEMDGTLLVAEIKERSRVLFDYPGGTMKINQIGLAIDFAAYFHRTQRRRNRGDLPKDPYINHPLRNALRLLRYGVTDSDIIVAAVLHDVVEDCSDEVYSKMYEGPLSGGIYSPERATLEVISNLFNPRVMALVQAVTNPEYASNLTKAEKRSEYIKHVSEEIRDAAVWLVKFADWVDNAAGLYHNVGGPEMVKHLTAKYLPLADVFQRRFDSHVHAFISADGFDAINKHIDEGRKSLTKLAEDAA